MRIPIIAVTGVIFVLLIFPQAVIAQDPVLAEPYTGSFLCLPDEYPVAPTDCLTYGPSETLTRLAEQGLQYPPRPILAKKPPADLTASPVFLAKINLDPTLPVPLYATLDDAVAGNNAVRTIAPGHGLRYVSYIQEVRVDGNAYVMIRSGEWVRASPAGSSGFQGLLFPRTPSTGFGWVIDTIFLRACHLLTSPFFGKHFYLYF